MQLPANDLLSRQEKAEALAALLQARVVREPANLSALPAYLGQKALAAEGESLKDYTVGVEALDKLADYDPRLEATVRVNIGKLCARLREHHLTAAAPIH